MSAPDPCPGCGGRWTHHRTCPEREGVDLLLAPERRPVPDSERILSDLGA